MNTPEKRNDLDFCNKYISLSENYWSMADKDIIDSIEAAMQATLIDYHSGKLEGQFKGKSESEIKRYFLIKKLNLYETIPKVWAERIQREIDKFLRSKGIEAKRNGLIVPNYGSHLKVSEYLANYLVAQENKKRLELYLGRSF